MEKRAPAGLAAARTPEKAGIRREAKRLRAVPSSGSWRSGVAEIALFSRARSGESRVTGWKYRGWASATAELMDDSNIWERILARIETKVNRHSFYTWFKPTSFLDDDGSDGRRPRAERAVQGLAD